jgi:ribonuclease E
MAGPGEGLSPMATAPSTPVETPLGDDPAEDVGSGEAGEGAVEVLEKDETIETVAEEEDHLDLRPRAKPRARRYKIQEVIKVRQIMLVQVVKEERGNKGAALTTYLSLAGRYCVLMPNTARGGGISRKITNAVDRKKLKEIAGEMDVPEGAGLIIRTAGSQRTKAEIKRDYEYLQRLWEQIRELTLKSIAPAKIYEEGDLIKRSIRDLYSKEIDEVIVAGAEGFQAARDFMRMIMPSHAKSVVLHQEPLPLFARYGVESFLASMFNPTVQLPSGGYIVIGVTEALVAIDVNSGRATKEGSIEQTALKTNLEAADEVARQLRLRDLAGLIVIDFIDMEERRNNAAVEKRFKDKLKTDRARIQVGRISGFGLLEMSRQRLRPGMLEATTQPCPHCHGTGLLRSDDSVALAILRQIDEEGVRGRTKEILVRAPVGIANYLINNKREHVASIEQRYGMAVRIEADIRLVSPDHAIEKFRTATRVVPEPSAIVMAAQPALMPDEEDFVEVEEDGVEEDGVEEAIEELVEATDALADRVASVADTVAAEGEDDKPRRKRRRRRRRRGGERDGVAGEAMAADAEGDEDDEDDSEDGDEPALTDAAPVEVFVPPVEAPAPTAEEALPVEAAVAEEAPRRRTRVRSRAADAPAEVPEPALEDAPAPRRRTRSRKPAEASADGVVLDGTPEVAPAKPTRARRSRASAAAREAEVAPPASVDGDVEEPAPAAPEAGPAPELAGPPEAAPEEAERLSEPAAFEAPEPAPQPTATPQPEAADRPKRRGWWSLGRG